MTTMYICQIGKNPELQSPKKDITSDKMEENKRLMIGCGNHIEKPQ